METVKDAKNHKITTFSYDPSDLNLQNVYFNGDHQNYGYDADHNLIWRRVATPSASPAPTPIYQVFTYDTRNRKTIDAAGTTIKMGHRPKSYGTTGLSITAALTMTLPGE